MTEKDFIQYASLQILQAAIARDVSIKSIAEGSDHPIISNSVIAAIKLSRELKNRGYING